MPIWESPDGQYMFAMQTPGEGDGNSVVYRKVDGAWTPVWDRFSEEAKHPDKPATPFGPTPSAPVVTTDPLPHGPVSFKLWPVTDDSDGPLVPRMYSYWPNSWVYGHKAVVFVGHADGHPRFFSVHLETGAVERLGPMLGYTGTSEGWCWDPLGWVYLVDGTKLMRVSPFTNEAQVVFDVAATHPGHVLWQTHSSDDGRVHSATLLQVMPEGSWPRVGTVLCRDGQQTYYPALQPLDESAITPDGAYLVIKEGDDNRVITVATGEERMIKDAERALGHSDCGPGYMVGEADKPDPGMCGVWNLGGPLTLERFQPLFQTWNMGYVSVRRGRILHSSDTHLRLIDIDTGAATELLDHGVRSNNYDERVKANLDHSGRVATYMANGRVYILVLSE